MNKAAREILLALLKEIEEGRVCVEPLLERAFRDGGKDYRTYVKRLVEKSKSADRQRVCVRRRYDPDEMHAAVAYARERLAKLPGVVAISWGIKRRNRALTHDNAIIVWVKDKTSKEELKRESKVPTRIRYRGNSFLTDVQRVPIAHKHAASSARPGAGVEIDVGDRFGTLSCVLDDGMLVFSGHVALANGVAVTATLGDQSFNVGSAFGVHNDSNVDVARVGPVDATTMAAFSSGPLPLWDTPPASLLVHVERREGTVDAFIDAVNAPAYFAKENQTMYNLIRLDQLVTVEGDSGAPVLDGLRQRLIGFVVGAADSHTFIIPAGGAING